MTMSNTAASPSSPQTMLVKKSITVAASPERAFHVFTQEFGSWWPLATHHLQKVDAATAIMEPFVGGRWFERGVDGSECNWGRVLAWEPPGRVVLAWEINADWQPDVSVQTEVEVRFIAEGGGTRVELEHRLLERYGERAEQVRAGVDSPDGWGSLLAAFGARVAAA
jgi:uncharacterized protein YndB with AHSA1/START domain